MLVLTIIASFCIIMFLVFRTIGIEADYLGKISTFKLQLKEKDREISELKNKIRYIENPQDIFDIRYD